MSNTVIYDSLEDTLSRSRECDELDSSLWNDKCDYVELDKCVYLNPNNDNLIVVQLNIQSLLSHQQDLCQLIRSTEEKNSRIDILLLCETFLSKNTCHMVKIPGFTHVSKCQKNKKDGGVTILIRDGISYRRRTDLDVFDEGLTESIFIEVRSKNGKQIIFGSLYKPPDVGIDQFMEHLSSITYKVRQVQDKHLPEMVLGMDHNMNLLNSAIYPPTHKFIETLSELKLYPTITHPICITHHSATLINNIFVTEILHRNFESTILIDDISDHLPTLAMLKQTRLMNHELIAFNSRCLSKDKLKQVNHKLMRVDWIGVLTGTTSDEKFNQFSDWIEQVLDDIAPIKCIRISAKRQFVKPWMTRGLEVASHKKLKLYKKTPSNNCTEADQAKYKEHRNLCNSLKLLPYKMH